MPEPTADHTIVGGIAVTVINLLAGMKLFARTDELEKIKTHVAENYVNKADMDKRFDGVEKRLEKLDQKLDVLIEGKN